MEQAVTTLLKRNQVRLMSGPAQGPQAPLRHGASDATSSPGAREPQARIVRQTATMATIEVTCECGQRILLECEYAPSASQGVSA